MTSRLLLYNDALTICGERSLASLTEEGEPRRLLDQQWDNNGIESCLERGQWKFAMRTVQLDADPSIDPDYGYQKAYVKPSDWVLTSSVCQDEYFNVPLLQYVDEQGHWYSEIEPIYVRYVSNDANYGRDLSNWPATFADYVAAYFASKIILKLTADDKKRDGVIKWADDKLMKAKSNDAMAGPQQFPAPGNWVQSRNWGRGFKYDRGSRNRLIG